MSKNGSQGANYAISQNFLTSRATIQRCLSLARLGPQDTVLEIGTGKGHITRALACRCKRVLTYEIDPDLCRTLEGKLPGNVRLVRGDFLRAPLPKGPYKVFANIPFSLTSAIVSKLTTGPNLPSHMYLFMEKGAAKRFCGLPGESRASLLLRPWFDVKILYHFRREDFHPAPGRMWFWSPSAGGPPLTSRRRNGGLMTASSPRAWQAACPSPADRWIRPSAGQGCSPPPPRPI